MPGDTPERRDALLRLAWVKTDFHSWLREEQNDGTYLVVGHVYCGIVMIWRGRIMLGSEAEGIGPFPTRAEAEDAVERAVIERMGSTTAAQEGGA